MSNVEGNRKTVTTTLEERLYREVKKIAIDQDKYASEIMDEGMFLVIKKYKDQQIEREEELKKVMENYG